MSTAPKPAPSQSRPAPGPAPDPSSFIRVRTTRPRQPFPPNSARQPITTERLVLRVLTEDDFASFRVLRTQPEVMHWTAVGVPDPDDEVTWSRLRPFLTPREASNYNFAICLRDTGEFIGIGGCHALRSSLGWPEVGYMLRKEAWGKGYGSEFLRGWLRAWDQLEREVAEIEVDARTIDEGEEARGQEDGLVKERLLAITAEGNDRSQGVLKKAGFEWFLSWLAVDSRKDDGPDKWIELPTFRYFPKTLEQ
ncbi:GNAT domain-containing protein [Corynascus similis CBS 632.67]